MTIQHSHKEEARLKQIIENWAEAVCKVDMNGVLANHTNDILLFDVPASLQSKEVEAYKKSWEMYFSWSQKLGVFVVSELEIIAGNDVAFCHGLITCTGTDNNNLKEEYKVRLTMCFRKINGQWLIKHEPHSLPSE